MADVITENATEKFIDSPGAPSERRRLNHESRGCYFTPVSNSVFTAEELTTKARQILLILELKAGSSRIAKLSNQEIIGLTGYSRRTVERSLRSLRNQELISQSKNRAIELSNSIPAQNYVPVYESVVHHPQWEDWQKHLLLFVMSQFRGHDPQFGIKKNALNLYGRKGQSIERFCKIPGSTTVRRKRIRKFVEQLQNQHVIEIVEEATCNRPAICIVNRDTLEGIVPDYERHQCATLKMTVPHAKPHRHASRSNTVTPHVAHRHPSRSNTVTPHVATPSSVTYVKDSKDSEDSKKILESPRSACGGRGAISSLAIDETSGDNSESGYEISEFSDTEWDMEDGLAALMESERHADLTREVERRCIGFHLNQSRAHPRFLAGNWTAILEELPGDLEADDVVSAITSSEFDGLDAKSWGLLLADKFIKRFFIEIKKNYDQRKRSINSTQQLFDDSCKQLRDDNAATRKAAVERLVGVFGNNSKVPLMIAGMLIGECRDDDPSVRLVAARKLVFLVSLGKISIQDKATIRMAAGRMLQDDNEDVRDEIEYLQRQLDNTPVSSGCV